MKAIVRLLLGVALACFTAACGSAVSPATVAPGQQHSDLPGPTFSVTPGEALSPGETPTTGVTPAGLSDEALATLGSLKKVAEHPLYVMHYAGAYDYPRIEASRLPEGSFACSLFASLNPSGDMLYGRNFDWEFSPALLLFTDPPDGYASLSLVDLTFLGIDSFAAGSLDEQPLEERRALLAAPSMPFDGMNEHGLAIGMAAVPELSESPGEPPSKPTIGSIGVMRLVLDHARTVDEAVSLFEQYTLDFTGGPPVHYLLADPSGKAVLVEFYQGRMQALPNQDDWHLATNHLRCIAEGDGGCRRYAALSERLAMAAGLLDEASAMDLLARVAQPTTQWSAVYNMSRGELSLALGTDFDNPLYFQLTPSEAYFGD